MNNDTPKTNAKAMISALPPAAPVQITPKFQQLSEKGAAMFADMGNAENAKLFLEDLMMQTGNEHTVIAGLLLMLDAIDEKIAARLSGSGGEHPGDYIGELKTFLFSWTIEASLCADVYIEAVKSGRFTVENFVRTDAPLPPTQELKAVA